MPLRELSLLYDITRDATVLGAQAAGTQFSPSSAAGDGEMDTNEVAEIVFAEVFPPVDGLGNPEDLANVRIVLDNQDSRQFVRFPGRMDTTMTPPVNRLQNNSFEGSGQIVTFGKGLVASFEDPVPALSNTSLKYKRNVRIVATAGATPVTTDYRIRLWGYRYFAEELPRAVPGGTMPGNFQMVDRERDRRITIPMRDVPVTFDNWTLLPGGMDQGLPRVMPFWRFASNANATILNRPYQFRFDTGNVAEEEQDLFFEFDLENKALIINTFGVRRPLALAGAWSLGAAWIEVTGDALHEEHPKNRIPLTELNNIIQYGATAPIMPAAIGTSTFYPVPKFAGQSLPVFGERAFVAVQDDGLVVVPAGEIVVALTGVLVELETGIVRPA